MNLERGAIHRVRLNPTQGHEQRGEARPCLIVHRNSLRRAGTALVVPLTSKEPRVQFPLVVPITFTRSATKSWAKITQLRVVAQTRFVTPPMAQLSEEDLEPVKEALRLILDL